MKASIYSRSSPVTIQYHQKQFLHAKNWTEIHQDIKQQICDGKFQSHFPSRSQMWNLWWISFIKFTIRKNKIKYIHEKLSKIYHQDAKSQKLWWNHCYRTLRRQYLCRWSTNHGYRLPLKTTRFHISITNYDMHTFWKHSFILFHSLI